MLRMARNFFQTARAFFYIILFWKSSERAIIERDIDRWVQRKEHSKQSSPAIWKDLVWLVWRYPEFRNLFFYRVRKDSRFRSRILSALARLFYKPLDSLYIDTPLIGGGLFIQHGFSTIISAESIGENCWINQQVTIGYQNRGERPTIGDNVSITAGAKVIGKIKIGDNSVVGANAVVIKDVPPNCTVVGVPAYIVKRDGKKTKEELV